ncbi:MAG: carbamoyltransferase C-terminal domain-containing protein [Pseudomonadota bacterium]
MYVLGIHIGHDGGAALIKDGKLIVAISEERLSRKKHSNGWWLSVIYCLTSAKISFHDIELIVWSNCGPRLSKAHDGGIEMATGVKCRTVRCDHHLSHALGAIALSGKKKGLVFVTDGGGNEGIGQHEVTESAFVFDNNQFHLAMQSDPHRDRCKGLGTAYDAFTGFLGFGAEESGKTMGLSAYGSSADYDHHPDLFNVSADGRIESLLEDTDYWGVMKLSKKYNLNFGDPFPDGTSATAANIAKYIQVQLERTTLRSIQALLAKHDVPNVLLSGGVALNCVSNNKLSQQLDGVNVFPCPPASDSGLPLGNAVYGYWKLTGEIIDISNSSMRFGRDYSEDEIQDALKELPDTLMPGSVVLGKLKYTKINNPAHYAADLIASDHIIAWWQGKSEYGPRALGGRSILANPRGEGVRQCINDKVKRREWFRPFGPAIREAEVTDYLDSGLYTSYMTAAPKVNESGVKALGECVHTDTTCRIQAVPESSDPYALLLDKLKKDTGYGCVLNTSFNIQEPIVESPGDAIATFLRSKIDYLILGDYLCERIRP